VVNVGIFAIDPGIHTGLAWGIINPHARLAADAMRERIKSNSITIVGEPLGQAREIWRIWEAFFKECVVVGCMDPEYVNLVSEDFVLRPGPHAGGKDGTAPERIIFAFDGYRNGRYDTYRKNRYLAPIYWQQPSAASRYNSQKMLKPVGAWVVGREHERSAMAHMYLRTATIMSGSLYTRPRRRA
jgi:hypothetical protein